MLNDPWFNQAFMEHELVGASYQFDLVGITRRESDGLLMWATDGGCSCPSPWDRLSEADWKPLKETWAEFEAAVRAGDLDGTTFLDEARKLLAA